MKNKNLYLDTFRWMIIPAIFQLGYEILAVSVTFVTANYLGITTDAAFHGDYESFFAAGRILLLCLAAAVIVVPAVAALMDFVWIKAGSVSDIEMCSQMSYWKYDKLKAYEEGEIEYKLSEELCEFRIRFGTICSDILVIPFFLGFVIYCVRQLGGVYTAIGIFCSFAALIIPVFFRKRRAGFEREGWEYNAKQNQIISQISEQAKAVKIMGLHEYFIKRWHTLFFDYFSRSRKKANRVENFADEANEFVRVLSQLVILVFGCVLVQNSFITVGGIVMMLRYFGIFDTFLGKGIELVTNAPVIREKARRLHFLYEEKERDGGKDFKGGLKEIQCRNLTCRYGEKTIIDNLSFSISKGEKVQIAGENGSGKTTLIRLLCGLEQNFEGEILLNRINIKEIDLNAWRKRIAVVFQNDYIFPGTVFENVKMGDFHAADNKVETVMDLMSLLDLRDRCIEYGAKELSGGEKKKISIARAMLKNSELVIFDEGDTHLDAEKRKALYKYLEESKQTIIFISHDAAFGKIADRVVSLLKLSHICKSI